MELRSKSPYIKATRVQPAPGPGREAQRGHISSVRRSRKSEQGRKALALEPCNVCSNHSDRRNPPACQTCPPQAQRPVPSTRGSGGVIHTLLPNAPLLGCLPGALHLLRPRALKAALSVHTLPAVAHGGTFCPIPPPKTALEALSGAQWGSPRSALTALLYRFRALLIHSAWIAQAQRMCTEAPRRRLSSEARGAPSPPPAPSSTGPAAPGSPRGEEKAGRAGMAVSSEPPLLPRAPDPRRHFPLSSLRRRASGVPRPRR